MKDLKFFCRNIRQEEMVIMDMTCCPVCGKRYKRHNKEHEINVYECERCGAFKITEEAIETLDLPKYQKGKPKISSYLKYRDIRNLEKITLFQNKDRANKYKMCISIDEAINIYSNEIYQRINNAIMNISLMSSFIGDYVPINNESSSLLYCDAYSTTAIFFILEQLNEEGYIEIKKGLMLPNEIRLTVKGWNKVDQLKNSNIDSKDAFVAMSFNSDLDNIYNNGISKAIEKAGYNSVRVDAQEYNSKICDEIIADIRKAKFVVADSTNQNNGVYFEAGFAMGLGKPVIWACRKNDIKNLHFDTRQYNHIIWENEEDLYEALLRRIEATIY
jgi:nucleoside 2-deoxyribosyltransferase